MTQTLKAVRVLLVGAQTPSSLEACFRYLGWEWDTGTLEGWLDPALGPGHPDAALVDMTGPRSPELWLRIHHMVSRVPYPLVLVVDGPVPSSFHYPRAGGLRVGLLPPSAPFDVVRSTVNLVRQVYHSVRTNADQGPGEESLWDAERRGVVLESLYRVQQDLEAVRQVLDPPEQRATDLRPLGSRERDVLGLLMKGLPVVAMAERLGISESTVKKHLTSIYRKRGVSSRAQLMAAP